MPDFVSGDFGAGEAIWTTFSDLCARSGLAGAFFCFDFDFDFVDMVCKLVWNWKSEHRCSPRVAQSAMLESSSECDACPICVPDICVPDICEPDICGSRCGPKPDMMEFLGVVANPIYGRSHRVHPL